MSIQHAIQLNNQAVFFLEHKLIVNAFRFSCAAMEMFQLNRHSADRVSLHRLDAIDQFLLDNDNISPSDDNVDEFIYERGIVLPAGTMNATVIAPVLIFNCALCNHLLGKYCSDDATTSLKYLDRARQLYRLAFNQQDPDANAIFKFVLANNLGVIHKRLGDHEESKQYFGQLVSLMMTYVDMGVESERLRHIQGFWKNTTQNGCMAPAA